ncbi:hypothetical protein CYLTODRAFT_346431 [Cylindrobasidium torrendii FP15055 ss-10]|uniref:Uncharacterized protein n=1 Tax=Cylindrobasidium torrendii FP15055 ss-10 TaxID=1314674 RepID=A0A0D7BM19_9AGAR|nr:hypothetical protein CYLTODRAFT_346431 [Cylindrobasidium torrendii FP15055 ss-10]
MTSEWEDEVVQVKEESESELSDAGSRTSSRRPKSPRRHRRRAGVAQSSATPRRARVAKVSRREATPAIPPPNHTIPAPLIAASGRATPAPRHQKEDDLTPRVLNSAANGTWFLTTYVFSALGTALRLAKPLVVLAIVYLLVSTFVGHLIGQIGSQLRVVLEPFCTIPIVSSSPLCVALGSLVPGRPVANFPALVEIESTSLERVLDQLTGGSALALDVKKSEIATKDLILVVGTSNLRSKSEIEYTLQNFVRSARRTSEGLQKLTSHIQFAVDGIVAVNNFALGTIESARVRQEDASVIARLNPFATSIDDVVSFKFHEVMDYISVRTDKILAEGAQQINNLDQLEQYLDQLAELVAREDDSVKVERDDVLPTLWARVINPKTVRKYERDLDLLKDLSTYRKQALIHVVTAMQTLGKMNSDIEAIRDGVALPALTPGSGIPVEVHMRSIQSGMEHLRQVTRRARDREISLEDTRIEN